MNRIEIILAGAGSGKTTALARRLEKDISEGTARPHAILATTFTRSAAAELTGRARTRLLSAGHTTQAHQLGAARIGTVNAVCGALVETYAFELGLSPDLVVLDEHGAAARIGESVSAVMTDAHRQAHTRLAQAFDKDFEIEPVVIQILAAARANELSAEDLKASSQRSVEAVLALLDPAAEGLDDTLRAEIEALLPTLQATGKTTDGTAASTCKRVLALLEAGTPVPWSLWRGLSRLKVTVKLQGEAAALCSAADRHLAHPAFAADLQSAVELAFELAAGALSHYEDIKRQQGVIDFTDQEAYALQLLRMPEVAQRLGEDLDLVMVDEFQDTSPIQLAIFLQLAQIAKTSVWVGDPKQSIYGFRGTDPEMMTAAVEQLEGRDPEFVDDTLRKLFERTQPTTLEHSYRSRPELVRLTSELFARAFATQGMPRERVVLEPGHSSEPDGLGAIVEVWDVTPPKGVGSTAIPKVVAAGIDGLLGRGFKVRVKNAEDTARDGTAGDIAVLSRRRATRDRTATTLEALGHRVVLPRNGLLDTLEGRALWAGLRCWVDSRDTHAAAELGRLLGEAQPQAWLEGLLADEPVPGPATSIDRRREAVGPAGAREAAAHCCDALDLRTACRRWGDHAQRLANLDAFFAFIDQYLAQRETEGGVGTIAGLLAELDRTRKQAPTTDAQGVQVCGDAITASTWHGAKGLEWPLVVLSDLETTAPSHVGGVRVEPSDAGLDLTDPLQGRWIRYVPFPYSSNTRDATYVDRVMQTPAEQRATQREAQEQLRVLYVAWTRARDRLILAAPAKAAFSKALAALRDDTGTLLSAPVDGVARWIDRALEVPTLAVGLKEPKPLSSEATATYPTPEPRAWSDAFSSPSHAIGAGEIVETVQLGDATEVHGLDGPGLGEAFHAFIAADPAEPGAQREAFAAACLRTWGVQRPELAAVFVAAADRFRAFVQTRFAGTAAQMEVPLWSRTPEGVVSRGRLDVWVPQRAVIDHKTMLGSAARQIESARGYAGQLEAYAAMLHAADGVEVERWVHLPLAGLIVRVGPTEELAVAVSG